MNWKTTEYEVSTFQYLLKVSLGMYIHVYVCVRVFFMLCCFIKFLRKMLSMHLFTHSEAKCFNFFAVVGKKEMQFRYFLFPVSIIVMS